MVPSQVYFSPPMALVGDSISARTVAGGLRRQAKVAAMTERTVLGNGLVQVTNTVSNPIGAAGVLTSAVITNPDGTVRTVYQTATSLRGVTTYSRATVLPDGSRQSEEGTEVAQATATTILPDGSLQAHPGRSGGASRTTSFQRVITREGGGTGSIVGATVAQAKPGRVVMSTTQQVTNFEGSQEQVRVFTTRRGGVTTTRETIILFPSGLTSTSTSTTRVTSST